MQPIVGDWRAKVKAAKKAAKKADKPPKDGQPDLKEASRGLPAGWQAIWDAASKKVYFGNMVTKVQTLQLTNLLTTVPD